MAAKSAKDPGAWRVSLGALRDLADALGRQDFSSACDLAAEALAKAPGRSLADKANALSAASSADPGESSPHSARGADAHGADDHKILTKLVRTIKIFEPKKAQAASLEVLEGVIRSALADPDRLRRSLDAFAGPSASDEAGRSMMTDPIEAHIAALDAVGVDEGAFRTAYKALFNDGGLKAEDEKTIIERVTGAPKRRLSSARDRRDELERWFASRQREASRAERRALETSRF